jgi:hypothetical protein
MRLLLLCMLFSIYYGSAQAQPIFLGFEGERQIVRSADIKIKDLDIKKGKTQCGDYFLYQDIQGSDNKFQHVVTFMVNLPERKSHHSDAIVIAVKEDLIIKFDNRLKAPTAEYSFANNKEVVIIRISRKDFRAAACISGSP